MLVHAGRRPGTCSAARRRSRGPDPRPRARAVPSGRGVAREVGAARTPPARAPGPCWRRASLVARHERVRRRRDAAPPARHPPAHRRRLRRRDHGGRAVPACRCRAGARPRPWPRPRLWPSSSSAEIYGEPTLDVDAGFVVLVVATGLLLAAVVRAAQGRAVGLDQVAARLVGVAVAAWLARAFTLERPDAVGARGRPDRARRGWSPSAWWPSPGWASRSSWCCRRRSAPSASARPWLAALRDEFGEVAPLTLAVVGLGPDGRADGPRARGCSPCRSPSSRSPSPTSPSAATRRTG